MVPRLRLTPGKRFHTSGLLHVGTAARQPRNREWSLASGSLPESAFTRRDYRPTTVETDMVVRLRLTPGKRFHTSGLPPDNRGDQHGPSPPAHSRKALSHVGTATRRDCRPTTAEPRVVPRLRLTPGKRFHTSGLPPDNRGDQHGPSPPATRKALVLTAAFPAPPAHSLRGE